MREIIEEEEGEEEEEEEEEEEKSDIWVNWSLVLGRSFTLWLWV